MYYTYLKIGKEYTEYILVASSFSNVTQIASKPIYRQKVNQCTD